MTDIDKQTETLSDDQKAEINPDRIDALDTETFDAPEYQKDGQGTPRDSIGKDS